MKKNISVQNRYEVSYILQGLNCANCASRIEEEVYKISYVKKVELNFVTKKINVIGEKTEIENMVGIIQQITDDIEEGVKVKKDGQEIKEESDLNIRFWSGLLLFILAIVLFEIPVIKAKFTFNSLYLQWLLYGFGYLLLGGKVLGVAVKNIKNGQFFDENLLMSLATLGAFAIHEFPEAVAVMLFYMIGEMFQDKAVDRSRRFIKSLIDIRPDYVNLKKGDETNIVAPDEVQIGDIIIVKPGEKVPLDGQVLNGKSVVDTSALTGESVPRKVRQGDQILSGMINKTGLLTVKVKKEYEQSTVSKILTLVENAGSKKAPTEKLITRFARYYTPVVVFIALSTALFPPLFLSGATFSDWLYRALIFLVISCPCALVISIPLGFFGGIGRASRQGILVKGGNYLEALNKVTSIVFDKTGTLTRGKFVVSRIVAYNGYNKEEVLTKVAYAENYSSHPIAKTILKEFAQEIDDKIIEDYQEISGQGLKVILDGQEVLVGNSKLLLEEGVDYEEVNTDETIVYLAIDQKYAGFITLDDTLKVDTIKAIEGLKQNGNYDLTILTGDRKVVAKRVARKIGLDNYYAELLPHQKVEKVEELISTQEEKEKLIFVGDGINDAPVLAQSDIGVAMGGLGSDAAIEAADIVLMTDEPSKLIVAFNTARKTRNIVWQNVALALGVKGAVILMGIFGLATMWEAVFADVGVALLAVLNAMRISRIK